MEVLGGRRGSFGRRNVMNGSWETKTWVGNKNFTHAVPLFNPFLFCSNLKGAWPAIHPNDGIRGYPPKTFSVCPSGICRTTDALLVGFNRNRHNSALYSTYLICLPVPHCFARDCGYYCCCCHCCVTLPRHYHVSPKHYCHQISISILLFGQEEEQSCGPPKI